MGGESEQDGAPMQRPSVSSGAVRPYLSEHGGPVQRLSVGFCEGRPLVSRHPCWCSRPISIDWSVVVFFVVVLLGPSSWVVCMTDRSLVCEASCPAFCMTSTSLVCGAARLASS